MTQSDPEFNKLYNTYKNRVRGFIRSQVDEDADAEDIAQETWVVLWKIWPTYDPTRSFWPLAKYWASIMLLRHYHAKGKRRKVQELFSDLLKWFHELER